MNQPVIVPVKGTLRLSDANDIEPIFTPLYRLMLRLGAIGGVLGDDHGSLIRRYGIALAAVAVATGVRTLLDPILENRAPYGVYLIATVFVVWRAGLGPALAAVCGGALLARYLFEEPRRSLALLTEANYISLAMSLTLGTVTALLCESLRITAINNARLYRIARQADARKDEFLATLAHELRNPLAPIRNAIYVLNSADRQRSRSSGFAHHLVKPINPEELKEILLATFSGAK
jgi:K+-sensing histidine kinase KdpD